MIDSLRELQLIELDILKQVLAICQNHSLTYYMLGGTLLGAIRHKGFIPWDDDIDIGMPRPDYEAFLKYASKELVQPYQLHTVFENSGEYSYYYARVENADIKLLRKVSMRQVVIPAWIDVFPLDGVPDNIKDRTRWEKRFKRYIHMFNKSQIQYFYSPAQAKKGRPWYKRAIYTVFVSLKMDRLLNTKKAWKRLDALLKENEYEKSNYIINACGFWRFKEMFPKAVYGNGRLYQFEDIMLNGPEDYDYVLKQMYGDYMTPPPEDQREHHYIEFISEK